MSCESCYNGCVQVTPDECVRYTGPDIPALGITTGDTLKNVEENITSNLVPLLTGVGDEITLGEEDVCALIISYLTEGLVHNSQEWITALAKGECDLQTQITSINDTLDVLNADYTVDCLSGVTDSSDTHDVLQAAIVKICEAVLALDALALDVDTNYVKLADLNTLIQAYLDSQSSNITQQYQKMVPYTVVEYYGPLSNFDGTGAGIGSLGWDKVYLCNGLNGTPDKRGRVGVGAIASVPGGPLNAAVDPAYSGNPNYALNGTNGSNTVALTTPQLPSHTHIAIANSVVTDPGHTHLVGNTPEGWANSGTIGIVDRVPSNVETTSSTTGITVATSVTNQTTGLGQAHNNIQPVLATYYIMYIP